MITQETAKRIYDLYVEISDIEQLINDLTCSDSVAEDDLSISIPYRSGPKLVRVFPVEWSITLFSMEVREKKFELANLEEVCRGDLESVPPTYDAPVTPFREALLLIRGLLSVQRSEEKYLFPEITNKASSFLKAYE